MSVPVLLFLYIIKVWKRLLNCIPIRRLSYVTPSSLPATPTPRSANPVHTDRASSFKTMLSAACSLKLTPRRDFTF